ncbi:MAG: T9SS type A sorting domain-containing protein [Bacteroidia bacterium]
MKRIFTIVMILLCGSAASAQQTLWLKGKNLGNNLAHQVIDNCMDPDSDMYYLAGYQWSTQLLSGAVLPNGPTNGFVVKLDQNGDTVWTWNTSSSSAQAGSGVYVRAICNSPNNSVSVGGFYSISTGSSNIAGQSVSGSGSFIVRLNANGQVSMVKTYSGITIYDLDCDLYGNYYFSGNSQQRVVFGNDTAGPPPSIPGGGNSVDYLGSANSNGDPRWLNELGFIDLNATTAGNEGGQHRLTVCNTVNPFVVTAGFFTGTYAFANQSLSSNGSDDVLMIRFDTLGNYKSHFTFGGSNTESLHDIRSNRSGKLVVGGTYRTSTTINGTSYSTGSIYYQAFLIAMDTSFTIIHHDTGALSGWFPRVAIDEFDRTALAVFGGNNQRFLWTYDDTGARIFTKTLSYNTGTSFASFNPLGLAFSKKYDNALYFGAVFKPAASIDTFQITSTQSHNFDIAAAKFSMPSVCKANLGPDTGFCGAFQRTLSIGLKIPLDSIIWSTGDTTSSIQINQAGTFWVHTVYGTCSNTDSVIITQTNSLPVYTALNDTILCHQNTITVDLPVNNALQHQWSDLSKGNSIQVPFNRTLIWIQYSNYCGSIRDTMLVTRLQVPAITIGPDTTLCSQETITLGHFFKGTRYVWSTGDTNYQIQASAPGNLFCTATNFCGTVTDTIALLLLPNPSVVLGPDTFFCGNSGFTIHAQLAYDSILIWNTGTSGKSLPISSGGSFWLEARNRCGIIRDSLFISKYNFPSARIFGDSLLCIGDSIMLQGNTVGQSLWDDSSTGTVRAIHQVGTYWLQASNQCGIATDSLAMTEIRRPSPDLGPDTLICQSSFQLTLSPNTTASSYMWNTGSAQASVSVHQAGWFWVDANNRCGTSRDSIFIDQSIAPTVYLGSDTIVKPGFSMTLDAGNQGARYQWSKSAADTTRFLAVNQPGLYWVEVTNKCGWASDTIQISMNTVLNKIERVISLYPNPAKTGITITSPEFGLPGQLRIIGSDGRLVRSVETQGFSWYIPVDDLIPGLYFIQIDGYRIPFSVIE